MHTMLKHLFSKPRNMLGSASGMIASSIAVDIHGEPAESASSATMVNRGVNRQQQQVQSRVGRRGLPPIEATPTSVRCGKLEDGARRCG